MQRSIRQKTIATVAAWVASAAAGAGAPAALAHDLVPAALASAVAGYDRAQIDGDRLALQRYLADDYLLVNGAGELETKAQLIADNTAPGFKLNPFVVEKPVVKVWPGAAVMGGEVLLSGRSDGKAFSAHARFADIWRLRQGRWQVVYTQVTRLSH